MAFGRADGTFGPATRYTVGLTPYALAAADFNGDGNLDLVVGNSGEAIVSVLLNEGGGAFAPALTYASGERTTAVAAADLNGDQKVDFVAANQFSSSITIWLGVGDGSFVAGALTNRVAGSGPRGVAIADMDGDRIPDIVTADYFSSTHQHLSRTRGWGV